ncbi:hypothetical protein Mapa_005634 [Marchantia paleacea]|nr:hypothetical protein Mapa_005634 [Marchantia paleacea]
MCEIQKINLSGIIIIRLIYLSSLFISIMKRLFYVSNFTVISHIIYMCRQFHTLERILWCRVIIMKIYMCT